MKVSNVRKALIDSEKSLPNAKALSMQLRVNVKLGAAADQLLVFMY